MAATRRGLRPTSDGVTLAVFAVALAGVALLSGNNLLYLVLAVLLALLVGGLVVGAWNVAGVDVVRDLPDEVFADRSARGAFVVGAHGRLPVVGLVIEERGRDGALARLERVDGSARVEVAWRFHRRGLRTLGHLRVRSSWPFGLFEHWRDHDVDDAVWVWPRPAAAAPSVDAHGATRHLPTDEPDELVDLRPYRVGDRLRDVHWPTSARVGAPMVAVRAGFGASPVWIDVPPLSGTALEDALSAATGAVLDAVAAGRPVGLRVGGEVLPPRTGPAWRRQLLSVLAAVPDGRP